MFKYVSLLQFPTSWGRQENQLILPLRPAGRLSRLLPGQR